ncbi:attractin isoform X1 [Nasonia vitripennis]|uniref:Attractin n=1 Tax=Nasonia vitripennis TaxID=7425 RepID=A0A7M7PUH2_NASVI|nr:attractin isoform X1 [Nasonia vitripennis]
MILKYILMFTLVACFEVRALTQNNDGQKCSGKIKINQSGQSIISSIGNYSDNLRCSWLIEPDSPNSAIRLHIQYFETELGYDKLYIYEGDNVHAPLHATLSGYQSDRIIEIEPFNHKNPSKVLLYFSSDSYLNFAGFNITYEQCKAASRSMEPGPGPLCEPLKSACPNDCSGQGKCMAHPYARCTCFQDFAGDDCSQKVKDGTWEVIYGSKNLEPLRTSAGHCAYIWNNKQYIHGGVSYDHLNFNDELIKTRRFYGLTLLSSSPIPSDIPPLFGHSCVNIGNKAYLYGGMFMNSTDTNELWMYEKSSAHPRYDRSPDESWQSIEPLTPCDEGEMCAPIKVSGHTANLITGPYGEDKMLVIFGYSSEYGYLNTVQEYDFETGTWQIVNTTGFPVRGSYGHSSVYDESSNMIYVYGGLVNDIEFTNRLYAYHTLKREWKLAAPSPSDPRYLHSAVLVSKNLMLVYGGKISNMYRKPDTIVYDLTCDSWQQYRMPEGIDTSRYGHSAVMDRKGSINIFSGFDGEMVNNVLRYTPGTCEQFEDYFECLTSQVGLKCIWMEDAKSCRALDDVDNPTKYPSCLENAEQLALRMKACQELTDCSSCTQTSIDCVWCNGECSHQQTCPDKTANVTHSPEMCNETLPKESQSKFQISDENCAKITSCGNCTDTGACFWCQNQQQCYSKHAYEAVFPYGQCRDYLINGDQCPDANTPTGEWCSAYKNCTECGKDPACGWCDDLSGTGSGQCLHGSAGRSNRQSCPSSHRWYFTETCPSCQCNGHSTCHPDSGECIQPCNDFTEGPHCDRCQPGYWGNPANGEKCKVCECGSENHCDDKTGKCLKCETIGATGDLCEKCDVKKNYFEGPAPGLCYYDIETNYKYIFNLTNDGFEALRKVNFGNSALKATVPALFSIECSVNATVDVRIENKKGSQQFVLKHHPCRDTKFGKMFAVQEYTNGINENEENTVYVQVYEFKKPAVITISFDQLPRKKYGL